MTRIQQIFCDEILHTSFLETYFHTEIQTSVHKQMVLFECSHQEAPVDSSRFFSGSWVTLQNQFTLH